ncbi:hypothetical protein [Kordia sp. SMS9]|uniref:hypothetical protein n=1 Tax=Kordia sp. SMS9 TaxID=2282170 RepID=UPI0013B471EE|nr:hypothetical protein [Kordia sp. SMS9]
MKKQLIFLISILILIVACKSYVPFASVKEKKTQLELIKTTFNLTKAEFKKMKNEDSILFTVAKSLKKNIKFSLIQRRLDSFFLNNYNRKELLAILLVDYHFPHFKKPVELNRKKNAKGIEFKDMKEMKKFFQPGGGFEKDMNGMLGTKKKDSTTKKKDNK